MNIVLWLLIGGMTGWLFSKLAHKRTRETRSAYILLGMLGSLAAALIAGQLAEPVITWFDIWKVALAFIGAIVALGIGYLFLKSSGTKGQNS